MTTQGSPQGDDTAPIAECNGRVKWFNVTKGYGFVSLDSGEGDAFLHVTVLRQAGHEDVAPGVTLTCLAARGPKGFQVTAIVSLDLSTAGPMPRPDTPDVPLPVDGDDGDYAPCLVKWYNGERGYGFVCPPGTDKDVFVHAAILRRNGIDGLVPGQTVRARIGDGPKGLTVLDIRRA